MEAERELARLLADALGDPSVKRNFTQVQDGGYDIQGKSLRHFAVEAKAQDKPRWGPWLAQARLQAGDLQTPVLAHRAGGVWRFLADLSLFEFEKLVRFSNLLRDGKHP